MNSGSRDGMIQRIREAARTLPPPRDPAADPAKIDPAEKGRLIDRDLQRDELVALFGERAASSGAQVHIVNDQAALKETLGTIVPDDAAVAVACKRELLEKPGAEPRDLLPKSCRLKETAGDGAKALFAIDTAVTDADLAVAETGSVVLCARDDRARLASLVAEKHIVLVRPEQIVPDLVDWAQNPAGVDGAALPGGLTLITGPSKTADIEIKLVVGVHGPAELHLLVLDF